MANEQSLSKEDTAVINVAARRILGVGPSASAPALHSTAGVKSIRNLWFQPCAELLDSSPRVTNGAIQYRLRKWADGIYDAKQWMPMKTQHKSVSMDGRMVYKFKFYDVDVDEQWPFSIVDMAPRVPTKLQILSPSFSDAREIEAETILKALTYSYENAQPWCDVGPQILNSTGWRPDCATAHLANLARIPPPAIPSRRSFCRPELRTGRGTNGEPK